MLSSPLHSLVEIRGAQKGLLCKGCDSDFSDARGTRGSEKAEAEALWSPCQHRGMACLGLLVEDL